MNQKNRGFFPAQKGIQWICAALLAVILAGCGTANTPAESAGDASESTESSAVAPTQAAETEPAPTSPPDGDPGDVSCQGSYTVTDGEIEDAADVVVATAGDRELTNRELQIYYWMEVASYRAAENEAAPDFSQSLDTQICELTEDGHTWQQYFLRRALNTWHSVQALEIRGTETPLELEEAYNPDAKQHEDYLAGDLPALKYLYGYYNAYFTPNTMHQAYLDSLPQLIGEMAQAGGYGDVEALVLDLAGAGGDVQALEDYAWGLNWNYMYYTQLTYDMEITAEELDGWYAEHRQEADTGSQVDLRQILLIPEGAAVAADGTVTATDEQWEACLAQAEGLLEDWNKTCKRLNYRRLENAEAAEFGELANAWSADAGSRDNGGLYSGIRQGELIPDLDEWCFSQERQYLDTVIIRTAYGYHILCWCGSQEIWRDQAEADLLAQRAEALFREAMEACPMTVDYSAICLGAAAQQGSCVTREDLLYPDVAHERFPEVPLYLQRDYWGTYYGNYPVYTYGCGITTMAMLASYMTDEEWTVPELCAIYGSYCFETGTDYSLYDWAPSELGFYGIRRSTSWDEVQAALEGGAVAISIQRGPGYWTRRGHFILLQNMTEDGMVTVRDSNILNYGTIANHAIDAHEVKSITARNVLYWVLEEKVTRIGACWRCDDTEHEDACMGIFLEAYTCEKCTAAIARRNAYINALENIR